MATRAPFRVVTVVGIRPDFIRMSKVFELLDASPLIEHILIHTGQHYDDALSGTFFRELCIRKPDHQLSIAGGDHAYQLARMCEQLPPLLVKIKPDLVVFLGDSNTVSIAPVVKKYGYAIAHIEAGMRSGDLRMLEEINRKVCDMCSDILFVYHRDYVLGLEMENIQGQYYVVGNTISDVIKPFAAKLEAHPKRNDRILLDIHRPENFLYPERLTAILELAAQVGRHYGLPVYMLEFPRTMAAIGDTTTPDDIQFIELMGFGEYLEDVYHAKVLISDSGTGQEEPAYLKTPVITPRDFTERPQSMLHGASMLWGLNTPFELVTKFVDSFAWTSEKTAWMEPPAGKTTAGLIVSGLEDFLMNRTSRE